jgi:serine/threonine-protein kinase
LLPRALEERSSQSASHEREPLMVNNHTMSHLIGRSFNGYRVVRFIARGGMGLVFEGVQESLDRPVALKFLYPHLSGDDRFRERFEREARAVAQLNHPNIVRVLDYGVQDSYYFMVMDYIDGSSLRDRMVSVDSQGLTLKTNLVVDIVQQVGGALAYAHGLGFVHRDVKPGNIMLGNDGRAYLTDFGIVKMIGADQLTATGAFLGTPEYMSPEQASGGAIGPATDLYALAIVAFEMLVGRVPFQAPTPIVVMQKQLNEPPPLPSAIVPWFTPQVDAVFARALAKNPAARHASTTEFVSELVRVLSTSRTIAAADVAAAPVDPAAAPRPETPSTPGTGGMPAAALTLPHMAAPASSSGPPQAPYPPASTPQSHGAAPPAYATGTGGGVTPPGPPGTGYPVAAGANPPERRRGTALVGALLALLLLLAIAGFFLFMNDDDDGDNGTAGGSGADETATALALVLDTETATSASATATAPSAAATATTEVVAPATPTVVPDTPTATATATPTPLPTMVVYFAYKPQDAHNPQIYVMNLDGTDQRLFVEARGHSWGPVVSPDGSSMFFSSVTREGHTIHTPDGGGLVGKGDHDIYVVGIVGSDQASLQAASLDNVTDALTSWDNGWSWSPDGQITLTSDRPDSSGTTDWEIYLMPPVIGGEARQLTNTPHNEGWPVWTPDGKIVYASDETGDSEIWIMNGDGTNPQRLTNRPNRVDLYPSVSPDGTKIVFSSQIPDGNEGTIWIMDIDGGNLDQLTSTAALNNIPSWCPAGDRIVYVSNIEGNDNIYIMNADGSGVTPLTLPPEVFTGDPPENTTPHCSFLPGGSP